jgi:hypothetical protein
MAITTLLLGVLLSLQVHSADSSQSKSLTQKGVHRVDLGTYGKSPLEIWIVDGLKIRYNIYPQFVYGGNAQRYPFIPTNEIWIDNAISSEEFSYTVAHELYERDLMAKRGLDYADAHDSALQLEHRMRMRDLQMSAAHEAALPLVSPLDCEGYSGLSLPDSIKLIGIYRQFLGTKHGFDVWIVDGEAIRQRIYPDFGFSGSDQEYYFIPKGEIWIENAVSCEETAFSILSEQIVEQRMVQGESYHDAYLVAVGALAKVRDRSMQNAMHHQPVRVDLLNPDRLEGSGDEPGMPSIPETIDSVDILKR